MSGGRYNYLCFKDATEIGGNKEELKEMVVRLRDLGYAKAAKDTEEIFEFFINLSEKIEKLSDVWRAVEWMDSGDTGIEQVEEAIEEYNQKNAVN